MANSSPQQDSPLNEQERRKAGRAQLADDDERELYIKDDSSAAEGRDTMAKNWDGLSGEIDLWQQKGAKGSPDMY